MPVEVSFSSVFTARSARTIYGPTPYEEHVRRYLQPQSGPPGLPLARLLLGHCCIKAWCCGSHEKADRKCLTKVYCMHPHPSTLAARGGLRSQLGDGAGTQERRAGQIWLYGRTGHPWGCTGQP